MEKLGRSLAVRTVRLETEEGTARKGKAEVGSGSASRGCRAAARALWEKLTGYKPSEWDLEQDSNQFSEEEWKLQAS